MLHRSSPSRTFVALIAIAGLASGCKYFKPIDPNPRPRETTRQPAAAPTSTTPAAQAPAPANRAPATATRQPERVVPRGALSDPNIAAMVLALNNTDISYARLALGERAQRDDVKKFAERMLTDHTGVNGLVTQLLVKLDVAPVDNQLSLDMRDESANKRDIMRELSGYAFDSTYMENEVTYHQKFLSQIDNLMLRDARNAELRNLLTAVRPAVAAHLAHAEQVRADVLAKK